MRTPRTMHAQDDEYLNDRSRCALPLGKISITIGILAVLIALLVGIIRVGGDIHALSVELVKNNTLLQAKVNEISMALEKQSEQIDKLTLQLNNAVDHVLRVSNVTESTVVKINDLLEYSFNGSSTNMQILETTKDSANTLVNITEGLCNIGNISKSTNKVVDDILGVATELRNQNTLLSSLQPISCGDIKRLRPNSPTGYYYINYQTVYCNMDQLCGSGGGWTRVAYLDMSDAAKNCPSGFRPYEVRGKRVCGRQRNGCTSAFFFTNGISYSQICGRVEGYVEYSPDVFNGKFNNIDSPYVDGVSITRGSPRQHVWTLAARHTEGHNTCPCSPGSTKRVPSFIGNNYYCEAGSEAGSAGPLWDGQNCLPIETDCCSLPYLPWFYRKFNTVTTDYIELRVCCDQNTDDEDVPVGLYEIYIK